MSNRHGHHTSNIFGEAPSNPSQEMLPNSQAQGRKGVERTDIHNATSTFFREDGSYQPYYKPKAPPGGKSSISFGGYEEEKPQVKQASQPVERVEVNESSEEVAAQQVVSENPVAKAEQPQRRVERTGIYDATSTFHGKVDKNLFVEI